MHVVKGRHIFPQRMMSMMFLVFLILVCLACLVFSVLVGLAGPGPSLPQSQDSDKALARSGPGPANQRPVWPDLTNQRRGVWGPGPAADTNYVSRPERERSHNIWILIKLWIICQENTNFVDQWKMTQNFLHIWISLESIFKQLNVFRIVDHCHI